jgi:hypothetical protein
MKVSKLLSFLSPCAGISFFNNSFNENGIGQLIDNELCGIVKTVGFSYDDIIKTPFNIIYSGGDCVKDIQTHCGGIPPYHSLRIERH